MSASTGTYSGAVHRVYVTGVTLTAGETGSIVITGIGNSTITSGVSIINTGSITGVLLDFNTGNNTSIASGTGRVSAISNLSITKTANTGIAYSGTTIVYTISYVNNGPDANPTFTITDTLPNAFTFISATTGVYSGGIHTLLFTGGTLGSGETGSIIITGRANGLVASGIGFTNSVSVSGINTDPNTGDNGDSVVITGRTRADLSIVKTVSSGNFYSGDTVAYTLAYYNAGTNPTTGTITDFMPTGFVYLTSSAVGTLSGNILTFTGVAMPVGQTGTIVITGIVGVSISGQTILNSVTVVSNLEDLNTGNNSSSVTST